MSGALAVIRRFVAPDAPELPLSHHYVSQRGNTVSTYASEIAEKTDDVRRALYDLEDGMNNIQEMLDAVADATLVIIGDVTTAAKTIRALPQGAVRDTVFAATTASIRALVYRVCARRVAARAALIGHADEMLHAHVYGDAADADAVAGAAQ
jgi:hypothetical protein